LKGSLVLLGHDLTEQYDTTLSTTPPPFLFMFDPFYERNLNVKLLGFTLGAFEAILETK
jgi:hypothetical protein